jgi:hypothetical protein
MVAALMMAACRWSHDRCYGQVLRQLRMAATAAVRCRKLPKVTVAGRSTLVHSNSLLTVGWANLEDRWGRRMIAELFNSFFGCRHSHCSFPISVRPSLRRSAASKLTGKCRLPGLPQRISLRLAGDEGHHFAVAAAQLHGTKRCMARTEFQTSCKSLKVMDGPFFHGSNTGSDVVGDPDFKGVSGFKPECECLLKDRKSIGIGSVSVLTNTCNQVSPSASNAIISRSEAPANFQPA